ncbi:AraC family transcriptional regulator [Trinickia violacea]|uniref:AraC family transcriptional regulator n=1 Tax=Trinickia violacea TaxID=2571746 RepID=A0A4P8IWT8_9BURK|nr:AraC family transcriptional regulator [Trinickia violacea]QCP52906.1 AraC family transcriptional regulator [Trinickia violacea]
MDLLSRLLALLPVNGRVDVRCHFGAPWVIDHPAAPMSEIPYHVLLEGEATLEDGNGAPQRLAAGDIVLFPGGSPHRLHDGSGKRPKPVARHRAGDLLVEENRSAGERADILCGCFLLPGMPDRLLRDYLPERLVVRSRVAAPADGGAQAESAALADTRLTRLIQLMREEALDGAPASTALINHLSGALFALTLRFASEAPEPPRGLLALAQRSRLQPALAAMFDTPGKPWTLPALAELCHMSRATFVRHFDDALGRSANDVLTEIRMTLAARKLAQSGEPIAAIGEAVGYQSEAAFQRTFKRHTGASPARWRADRTKQALMG